MAVISPKYCEFKSKAELDVFKILKQELSDDWYVFYSFRYFDYLRSPAHDGEIDFLIYNPAEGMLILEVKGGEISYHDTTWYQDGRKIDPFNQAIGNKHSILALLKKHLNRTVPFPIAHAVCFPTCSSPASPLPLSAEKRAFFKKDLNKLPYLISSILKESMPQFPIKEAIPPNIILDILSPEFICKIPFNKRMESERFQFTRLTQQQCDALSAFEQFPRLQIRGCAGSGKTMLAIRKAKSLAAQGKHVLFLCYNRLLEEYLKRQVYDEPKIEVYAFYEFCIHLLKIPREQIEIHQKNPKLYSTALPKLLCELIVQKCLCYDAVIVDEGQDFDESAWKAISMLPVENGKFYIFYDPDQNIFTSELKLPDFGLPPIELSKNCRNTENIFNALSPYRTIPATLLEDTPMGLDVQTIVGDCRENLNRVLSELVEIEKIPTANIVVLGAHSLKNTSIGNNLKLGHFYIEEKKTNNQKYQIAYFTYMKFKGRESPIVILFDVNEEDPRWNRKGLYTAMSRAVHRLIILKPTPKKIENNLPD